MLTSKNITIIKIDKPIIGKDEVLIKKLFSWSKGHLK